MKTGIIGAGRIGATLARLLVAAGHQVRLANASGPGRLAPLLAELGSAASAGTPEEAVEQAELLVLMVPFGSAAELLPPSAVEGKLLVDAMNAFAGGGRPLDLGGLGSSEVIAERYPGARLVKSLNTMHFQTLATAGRAATDPGERLAHYVAGDDREAKETVSTVISELGFASIDTGSLRTGGRLQEPGGPLFNIPLTERQAHAVLGF
ncbi:NADP oxidoreductase [Sphaerisporangium melleum]|uniref:NADP oxidoreductase n=1 Tax=Sphaerisporangium melleum TaxID=321316 RepID=A0A917VCN4_9ACTN|nr:NAD(P)-binding domain-containing protein [Sphaerisporangium melleum]GGK63234.1 NADP oxidoreductase [Sphaerisporangium melleum]GII68063.1 NADP oxidoreductase [Sphaerisporangium melleum]